MRRLLLTMIILTMATGVVYAQSPLYSPTGTSSVTDFSSGGTMAGDLIVEGRGIINQLIVNDTAAISGQELSVRGDATITGALTTSEIKGTGALLIGPGGGVYSINIDGNGDITLNPDQTNINDTYINFLDGTAIFVNSSGGQVSVGHANPKTMFHIKSSGADLTGGAIPSFVTGLWVQSTAIGENAIISISSNSGQISYITFGDEVNSATSYFQHDNSTDTLSYVTGAGARFSITSAVTTFNPTNNPGSDFAVDSLMLNPAMLGNSSTNDMEFNGTARNIATMDGSENVLVVNGTSPSTACANDADCVFNPRGNTYFAGKTYQAGGAGIPGANIFAKDNESPTTIGSSGEGNAVQFLGFQNATNSDDRLVPDIAQNHILINQDGYHDLKGSGAVEPVDAQSDKFGFQFKLNNGAVPLEGCHTKRQMGGVANQSGSISISCQHELSTGDTVELWTWNYDANRDILIPDFSMNATQLIGR